MKKLIKNKIHKTHTMGAWKSDIISTSNSDRFGEIRACKYCGEAETKTVGGHLISPALIDRCYK